MRKGKTDREEKKSENGEVSVSVFSVPAPGGVIQLPRTDPVRCATLKSLFFK